ncbi:MAG: glycosyltransferase, partial [Deltaproteobacteria bacterium]|nr:glycosyltransferase [Deltaproteobacteria bacterium]
KISGRPLVFDAFTSLYGTFVADRKFVERGSWKAKLLHTVDKWSCRLADMILVDTDQHIDYFNNMFKIGKRKLRRIFVGADEDIFYPRVNRKNNNFLVLFYGTFIPLHGIEYIIKAAKQLEKYKDIKFQIIGSGQTSWYIEQLSEELRVNNVLFIEEWVPYKTMPEYIARADICLGIFGNTKKAKMVIPTKVFQALAMKKPIITGDSPAAREALTDRENAVLCTMADAEALAESTLLLKQNKKLREKIAENSYKLFKEKFSLKVIGIEVRRILQELTN